MSQVLADLDLSSSVSVPTLTAQAVSEQAGGRESGEGGRGMNLSSPSLMCDQGNAGRQPCHFLIPQQ